MLKNVEYKYIVAMVGVFSIFMELLDSTIINVAVPTLAREFEVTSAATIQWVITGYLLSLAVFIPVSGWAGDRIGTKRVFIFALSTFTTASLLCALAWNIESLIGFRVLQGVGGGMLSPVAFSMVWRAFPPEERSKAAGIMVIPAAVAPASGPVVGGFLVEYTSWHWIFLVNLPIGIAALLISVFYLREHTETNPGRFDPIGFVLAGAGLASVVYALSRAGDHGFGDSAVIASGVGGAGLLLAFAVAELNIRQPMVDVRILSNALFRASNLAWIVTMFGFSSMIFLLTLQLQTGRGLTALEAGLTTFVMAIGVMMTAQPASRLYRVVGPQRLIFVGLTICALTTLALYPMDYETNLWMIRAVLLARGVGFGLVLVPLQAATYAQISPAQTGRATALYNATSQVASSFGVAVSATYLTSRLTHYGAGLGNPATGEGSLSAFQDSFLLIGIISLVGVAVTLLIRDRDAAATMAPQTHAVPAGSGEVESAGTSA
jgi:EmrB/QacA subfamily drug resistance transporter